MKSADRERDENAAVALALLQLARDILEGTAPVTLTAFGAGEPGAYTVLEYRTFVNDDLVTITAAKAVAP